MGKAYEEPTEEHDYFLLMKENLSFQKEEEEKGPSRLFDLIVIP